MATTSPLSQEINDVLRELVTARDEARLRAHLLGMDARRRLGDLEREVEAFENKLSQRGDWVVDHVVATARGLTRAIGELLGTRQEVEPTRARDVMSRSMVTCHESDNLNRAAQLMWEGDFGVVPVVDDDGKLVGILTDRDVCMAAYTRGLPLTELTVKSVMSTTLFTCQPSDLLRRVMDLMSSHQVRRLPVLEEDGRLVGIVSLADVARLTQAPTIKSHEARVWVPGVLAGISEPVPHNGQRHAAAS